MKLKVNPVRLISLLTIIVLIHCGKDGDNLIKTHKIQKGDFVTSVTETGALEAVHSNMITAPHLSWRSANLRITYIIEDGSRVNTGDVLAEFDRSDVESQIIEANSKLEMAQAELRKTEASHISEINDLNASLERAQIDLEIAQINLKQAEFESAIRRKELELALENQEINLDKSIKDLENTKKVHEEEINKLKLNVSQEQNRLDELNTTLEKLTVKAPSPGIAILEENWSTGTKLQVEDQLWRGQRMISLPDLDTLQAQLQINEVDISKIRLNQRASVRMDALPDTSFTGFVKDVAVLAKRKDRDSNVKIFDVLVQLTEIDTTMMPGMTVRCEIEVDRIPDAIFIPLDCLFKKEDRNIAYVKKGSGFQEREVIPGESSDDYVIILEGLKEGEVVSFIDPTLINSRKSEDKDTPKGT